MGIADFRRIRPREVRPNLVIDLSPVAGEGASVTFRQPQGADLAPDGEKLQRLRIAFPAFPEQILQTFQVMGACYVPDGTEAPNTRPAHAFGELARDHWEVYVYIVERFSAAFPQAVIGFDSDDEKNG